MFIDPTLGKFTCDTAQIYRKGAHTLENQKSLGNTKGE